MNRIANWEEFRSRGGRQNRLRLSNDEWESKVLALACEGNLLVSTSDNYMLFCSYHFLVQGDSILEQAITYRALAVALPIS